MKNFFRDLGEEKGKKLRKKIFLGISAISELMVLILLVVPYLTYGTIEGEVAREKLLPIQAFSLLKDEWAIMDGIAYLALGVFVFVISFLVVQTILFIKSLLSFSEDEKKLTKKVKTQLILVSIVTALYCFSGLIVCAAVRASNGLVDTVSNFYPFIIMVAADIVYALIAGLLHKKQSAEEILAEEKEEKKQKLRQERVALYKARAEMFIATLVIVLLAVVALLSNIVTIQYKDVAAFVDPIELSGAEILKNYLEMDEGGQLIAFILLLFLILISSVFFLSLISFLSRSDIFYKISLGTISVSVVACFLVGMFGKYYQVVQKLNEGMLSEYIKTMLSVAGIESVEYELKSTSLYYFLACIGVIAVLLLRNPYTRGVAMEKELALRKEKNNPYTIKGDVSLSDIPDNFKRLNDGTVVATDQATGQQTVVFADPCSIFTELDGKIPEFEAELEEKRKALFQEPTLPKLVQFIVQYARDSRLHLSYTEEDIATFLAGLGTTKLSILQGMSGTGKTSLPKIFSEALYSRCEIVEVESSWRDKNELLGYYNEFSKNYTPKKFTQALYRAKLNPETLTFIVLDEMNLSRIEYYFSDFLSLMENEPDKRELRLLNVGLYRTENGEKHPYQGIDEGHTLKIPSNVWFIGTANRDESTFEISDKVYDRAHTMNFNKRAAKVTYYNDPVPQRFLPVQELERLFAEAKKAVNFNVEAYPIIGEVEKLLAPYNISFGNRIAMQIESFVDVYCSCFAASESIIHSAVERILLSKVVSKLELKSVDNKEQLAAEFDKLKLRQCSEFILKLNED